ncbi:MAG: hypothetical protein RM049_02615 [Nostoc sp. DedQUE04]|uniref:hypothetical protein n=1 Tax=unclassified Nostoc TaxID=2593658 RepID=UPI002AD27246|nr:MULTISPECIES: hypothetical protein [unclassified Nostoc]MDZ8096978.1 hypothetical protein [Nostoc sp. DedQUE05]MDZ8134179.1 hypothetical protein [Nostoc sp. DedQUE04]
MNTSPRPPTPINSPSYPTEFQQVILKKSQNFVGRAFVFTAIYNFIQSHDRGYFTIIGAPSSGKSAILAKYVTENPQVLYWFLATFGDLGWGKAEGRGQKAEVGRVEVINSSFEFV